MNQQNLMQKPYKEWSLAQWLYDLETRNNDEIQLGLTRIQEVASRLQLHNVHCPVIHVAGTNGKGSTVTALESIYYLAGYKVGTYTSPHLVHFNERIRISLEPISDQILCDAFTIIEEARGETLLTYFELVTLAALWYFQKEKVDVIILEVGLGGRLDATNIVNSDLAIITTIDYDHQDFLGDSLDAIAYEKAGILRQRKPFIYADENPPKTIGHVASELQVDACYYHNDYFISESKATWTLHYGNLKFERLPKPSIQLKSAAAAVVASVLLRQVLPIQLTEILPQAMRHIFIPGRLQWQKGPVTVLYDVAHNAQSAQLLADVVAQHAKDVKVYAVFSALKNKDILGLIEPMKPYIFQWFPAQLSGNRAMSANLLLSYFKTAEICVDVCYNNPLIAFEAALNQAEPGDLIVVYGSFFTVGHIMASKPTRRFNETGNR